MRLMPFHKNTSLTEAILFQFDPSHKRYANFSRPFTKKRARSKLFQVIWDNYDTGYLIWPEVTPDTSVHHQQQPLFLLGHLLASKYKYTRSTQNGLGNFFLSFFSFAGHFNWLTHVQSKYFWSSHFIQNSPYQCFLKLPQHYVACLP